MERSKQEDSPLGLSFLPGIIMQKHLRKLNFQTDVPEKKELARRAAVFYKLLVDFYGADRLILKAIKLDALTLVRSRQLEKKVLGLQRIVLEDPTLPLLSNAGDLAGILDQLEEKTAELFARRSVEESIEQKINTKLQERHDEYISEVKRQLLKEEGGPENPQTLKKYAQLEKMCSKGLNRSVMEFLRPAALAEIVGQIQGMRALMSRLSSPFPQHILIYGPPGVGKTAAARLALEGAKKMPQTSFTESAPFVEIDATTLRWDPRGITNPLIGSVHDPIYQGARRELSDGGVPEPKPGLVTEAHSGVLFIDEIGEMDLQLQSKLLKVMEDKWVKFESAYYDPADPQVPKYIKKLFAEGAPADFVLIGATTRAPHEISPALRSRCSAIYFDPLSPMDIKSIVENAAEKLGVTLQAGATPLICRYTSEGRQAVNIVADAYGLALYNGGGSQEEVSVVIDEEIVKEVIQNNRLIPLKPPDTENSPQVGKVYGLAAAAFRGSVLEIEALAFPAAQPGRGTVRFNEAAGKMARDSVFNATSVLQNITGVEISDYDLHFNVVGGGSVDGPSAGTALFLALYSAVRQIPLRQDMAVSGELSLQGKVKPVGGLTEKLYGARVAGIRNIILPQGNSGDLPVSLAEVDICYVDNVRELLEIALVGGRVDD